MVERATPNERFVWIGPLRRIGGRGEVSRGAIEGLRRLGCDVEVVDSQGSRGRLDAEALAPIRESADGVLRERGRTCVYHAELSELPAVRELFPMPTAEQRIAYTLCDSDRLTVDQRETLETFDEVWVPTSFHREVFCRAGFARERIYVVPPGIDAQAWPELPKADASEPPGPFRFLACFELDWRKGFDLLLEAYLREFERADEVELCIKLLPGEPGAPERSDLVRSLVERVDFLSDALPRVRIVSEDLGRAEMRRLYQQADLYVSTVRASGWGVACREAMSCGTPSAAIDWAGVTEFMHEENSLLIPLAELAPGAAQNAGLRAPDEPRHWPEVEIGDVQALMRRATRSRDSLRTLGREAARGLRENGTLEHSAQSALERHAAPYRPRRGLLDKILPGLGLRAPTSLLEDARSAVFTCVFEPASSRWREALGSYLERYGPDDDVTLCLWADLADESGLDELADQIGAELRRLSADRPAADVQLTAAPRDHVPWERVSPWPTDGPAPA